MEFIPKKFSDYKSLDELESDPLLYIKEVYTAASIRDVVLFDELLGMIPRLHKPPLYNIVNKLEDWGYLKKGRRYGYVTVRTMIPETPVPEMEGVRNPSDLRLTNENCYEKIFHYLKEHPKSNIYEIVFNIGGSISLMRELFLNLALEKIITAEDNGMLYLFSLVDDKNEPRLKDITHSFTLSILNNRSIGNAILVHLLRYKNCRGEHITPYEITQNGMKEVLGKKQNTLSVDLRRLFTDKLIEWEWRHVKNQKRKLKAYFLTAKGIAAANEILRQESIKTMF